MLNEKKIAFVICYNNKEIVLESMAYINSLIIPDGWEKEVIGIEGADSITEGYNAAMHSSDAKYKVYLHQDVLIINKNFILDIIKVFENHPEYGMLGVLGSSQMLKNANYWENWDTGCALAFDSKNLVVSMFDQKMDINEVVAIDGMIMITSRDIEWREDIIKGFDFYDISQSMEFISAGYKIGVVSQKFPWCLHDCGNTSMKNYDQIRRVFCEEYREHGYVYEPIDREQYDTELINRASYQVENIADYLSYNNVHEVEKSIKQALEITECSDDIVNKSKAVQLFLELIKYNKEYSCSMDELIQMTEKMKKLLWRIEFGIDVKDYLILFLQERDYFNIMAQSVAGYGSVDPDAVVNVAKNIFEVINNR